MFIISALGHIPVIAGVVDAVGKGLDTVDISAAAGMADLAIKHGIEGIIMAEAITIGVLDITPISHIIMEHFIHTPMDTI